MIFLGLFPLIALLLPIFLKAFAGVGYRGWLKVGSVMVPVRTCGIEKTPYPIIGDDLIHGSSNEPISASAINYAEGRNEYTGSFATDLFADFWSTLKDWAVNDRHTSKTIIVSPNNQQIYTYTTVLINTLTINGNLNGNVTIDVNVQAKTRTETGAGGTYSATGTSINQAPIPYWKSKFVGSAWGSGNWASFGETASNTQVTAWSITINNNTIVQRTFDGTKDAHYVQQGMLNLTGTITVFNEDGIPVPSDGGSAVITITGAGTVTLPYIVITGYPMNFAGSSAKVTRTVPFRSLGTGTSACVTAA